MFDKILSIFRKKDAVEQPAPAPTDKKKMYISPFIKDIEDMLQITTPRIMSVACIFEAFSSQHGQNVVMAQKEFNRNEIPEDAQYSAAYYLDDTDTILIGRKYPKPDFDTHTLHFKNLTSAENLFSLAHELRHVWQKKYAAETYYKKNALHMEVINDIAEIDADAFAFAYVFSDRTPFTHEDVVTTSEEVCLQATADEGKRWKRVEEISKEYGLNCTDKLEELKANVDQDKINYLITIMKLNRMI